METFMLIHGARHAGWVWDMVRPTLEKAGHRVLTLDLPGYGSNPPPEGERASIRSYATYVAKLLAEQPEPVILVGHSMGGIVVSQAAENQASKVKKLIYVCAFLLKDGENITSRGGGRLKPQSDEDFRQLLYNDCSDEVYHMARARITEPPAAGYPIAVKLTEANYGRIPRYYIECTLDHSIAPERQREMYTDTPVLKVMSLEAGHMPMLSRPDELAAHLLSIADS